MDARYFRFAIFYFFYYAALGAYTPYVGRWVDAMGHGGYVVGGMLVLWYGTRIVAPPFWTGFTSRSATPGFWLVSGAGLTALLFAGFLIAREAWQILAVMAVFGLFFNAIMPQFEAMTLTELGARRTQYGRIRVWGSIGFLIVASSFGWLMDRYGNGAFVWLSLPLFFGMVCTSWLHRHDRQPESQEAPKGLAESLRRRGVKSFLMVALLMQLAFGPFYVFFTLHLQRAGHDGLSIGLLWGLGVLIEILLFWHAPRLMEKYGAQRLLGFCLAVTVVRWLMTAFLAASLPLMALAQASHAFSFAIFHACCMQRISELFPPRQVAAGQSLLYGFSSGIGGVLGAGMAAALWEWRGGTAAFVAGALVAAIAWCFHRVSYRASHAAAT